MAVTLLNLRTQARQRADMESSTFVSDSELNGYINASIAELHDILVQSYGSDYFLQSYQFTTVSGTDSYNLPSNFYKIHIVGAKIDSSNYKKVNQFNLNELYRYTDVAVWASWSLPSVRYRLVGNKIVFTPKPTSATDIEIWYTPVATTLSSDSDQFADMDQYAEYVVVDAAIKMMQKEESDVSVLMAQKQALKQRIEEASQNRNAGDPESISDVQSEYEDYFFRR